MQMTRNETETASGPSEWFTGAVYIDTIARPENGSGLNARLVHFARVTRFVSRTPAPAPRATGHPACHTHGSGAT
jgi:hypothetical protein